MKSRSVPALTVIVPAYNESARLGACIAGLTRFLKGCPGGWELIVVDDGSRDATAGLLDRLARATPGVVAVHLPRNRGKGGAVREGLRRARGRFVIFTDCDLSTPPSQIPVAVRLLAAGNDFVIGSRALPGTRNPVPQPLLRRIAGRVFNAAVQVLLGLPYADTQCGFKGLSSRAAKVMVREGRIDGFEFDVEWLLIAKEHGLTVREFPIVWSDRANTTVRLFRHSLAMFAALFRLQRRFRGTIAYHPVRAMPWILGSITGAVAVQWILKTGAMELKLTALDWTNVVNIATSRYFWASILLGVFSAGAWIVTLAKVELSFAFPMLSLGFVGIAVVSHFLLGETVSLTRVIGFTLVVLGVITIASSGRPQGGRS